ncbi:RNA 2'-phosphotransferase [Flavobacterium sediminis]|uniref:Probable RNA 2'-phosphotransferase n=1 Tax=Flavobacterium sediminis TaxID=2201181 RepID=A0A2U8QTL8_9FLAO|nr:RNA 2'-phosphotransferase [Flavobacterium sediminis]AWM13530.1 RNA 2'-phosphotransferase [Flavobacterium sediminis]
MNGKDAKEISKFLSLILRHAPQTIQLQLDENGWASVNELITKSNQFGKELDEEILDYVVKNNDKKRFVFNEDKTKIRASQGHSIEVELDLKEAHPEHFLYHGTVAKFLEAIQKEGLQKMSRQHVHLSRDKETATKVGSRRGKPIILSIDAPKMIADGYSFYLSENGVWLTDHVPVEYIKF